MPKRSRHSLSHYRLTTFDLGQLIPVGLLEILPGDILNHFSKVMIRLAPMAAPVMHPMQIRIHHFFVPHRLTWPVEGTNTWENFITGGPDGRDAQEIPTRPTTATEGDLLDYLGLPNVAGAQVSVLPIRAFNLIYNEFYRDQDLIPERGLGDISVPHIAWEKEYHTNARPWPQKGEDVTLPLGERAPVRGLGAANQTFPTGPQSVYETEGETATQYEDTKVIDNSTESDQFFVEEDPNNPGFPNIWADLTAATAAKVNDIRRAFALQRFAEVRARFGSRYPEYLAHLGVRSADARLQRPEFLGGGVSRMSISEVLQTANEPGPQDRFGVGDMYGHGIGAGGSNAYRRRFTEHGYVMSLLSVRPKQMFTNGIERTWLRRDREDYWQKELQFIGQQEVLEQELYATGDNEDRVFGWSDRYEEYRRQRSLVTGEFRSVLDYWHLGRQFEQPPALNADFINCVPSKRIFNDQTNHSLWCAVEHTLVARRLVAKTAAGRIF